MKHLTWLRPSPAMVVACLALGIALAGTSYAAIKLPANSVGAKQLKRNAVTGPEGQGQRDHRRQGARVEPRQGSVRRQRHACDDGRHRSAVRRRRWRSDWNLP